MTIIAEPVDGDWLIERGGVILRDAWRPPCIHYSADLLRWLWSYPHDDRSSPLAVGGFDQGSPIGTAALLPRRLWFRGRPLNVGHLCLVAVRPSHQGQGAAKRIYDRLLELAPPDVPILAYALEDSPAESALKGSLGRSGRQARTIGRFPGYGYLARDGSASAPPSAGVEDSIEDLSRFLRESSERDPRLLTITLDTEQWEHWRRGPWPRSMLSVRESSSGRLKALGLAYRAEIAGRQGLSSQPTIHAPAVLDPETRLDLLPDYLASAAAFAAPDRFVSAPNLSGFDEAELKRRGVRQTGSCYRGWLFHDGPDPLDSAVEIVSTLDVL